MVTVKNILYAAEALLRQLEKIDEDGMTYYPLEEAKYLHNLVQDYKHPKNDTNK